MLNMNDEMEKLLNEESTVVRSPKLGDIINAVILTVNDKNIIVGLGSKKDGIIPKNEANLEQGKKIQDVYSVGDEIKAKVLKKDDGEGNVLLSISKAEASKGLDVLQKALEEKTQIEVKIVKIVNGGVLAQYNDDITGFIPLSQLSDRYIKSADEYFGKTLPVVVINLDAENSKIIFSYRECLIKQKGEIFENFCKTVKRGDIISGKIMRFTLFGAFIDIGGIDGLLHISEMSWSKINNPEDLFSLGDTINVVILEIDEATKKISLGYKQTQPEPFKQICEKYKVGDKIKGKVVQIKSYGVFVSIEKGIDGLVHISEVGNNVTDINSVLKTGQEVEVRILELNEETKRISLSLKDESTVSESNADESTKTPNYEVKENKETPKETEEEVVKDNASTPAPKETEEEVVKEEEPTPEETPKEAEGEAVKDEESKSAEKDTENPSSDN